MQLSLQGPILEPVLTQNALEPRHASVLFVGSLPVSLFEHFIKILESNPTDRIGELCFQTRLININVLDLFQKGTYFLITLLKYNLHTITCQILNAEFDDLGYCMHLSCQLRYITF